MVVVCYRFIELPNLGSSTLSDYCIADSRTRNQSLAKLGLQILELPNFGPLTAAFLFQPRTALHASFAIQIAHF
jgi:hypothetical protein